ncbi:uncharacterized protein BJ171DRAFT_567806, partial [Polychytrium aggregatum]|uniref:uncharacterized protein n=1 Tax=Polychytrium aggregatum TaxID=110093 RepID=UPI0022FE53C4
MAPPGLLLVLLCALLMSILPNAATQSTSVLPRVHPSKLAAATNLTIGVAGFFTTNSPPLTIQMYKTMQHRANSVLSYAIYVNSRSNPCGWATKAGHSLWSVRLSRSIQHLSVRLIQTGNYRNLIHSSGKSVSLYPVPQSSASSAERIGIVTRGRLHLPLTRSGRYHCTLNSLKLTAIMDNLGSISRSARINAVIGESESNFPLFEGNERLGAVAAGIANVPYCSPTTPDPVLSDKSKYPTFFRTIPETSLAGAGTSLRPREPPLQSSDYSTIGGDLIGGFVDEAPVLGLDVMFTRFLGDNARQSIVVDPAGWDYSSTIAAMKNSKVRVFVVLAGSYEASCLWLHAAAAGNLTGSQFSWFVSNGLSAPDIMKQINAAIDPNPIPDNSTITEAFIDQHYVLHGPILTDTDGDMWSYLNLTFNYLGMGKLRMTPEVNFPPCVIDHLNLWPCASSDRMSFDCAVLIVAGWDYLLKNNLTTPEDIMNNQIPRGLVNTSIFNVSEGASGYIGLKENGNRESAVVEFLSMPTGETDIPLMSSMSFPSAPNQRTLELDQIVGLIPADYPVNIINPSDADVLWARVSGFLGMLMCMGLMAYMLYHRNTKAVAVYGITYTTSVLLGCSLGYTLMVVRKTLPDPLNCVITDWWSSISLTLCICDFDASLPYSPPTVKAVAYYLRMKSIIAKRKPVPEYRMALATLLALSVQVLISIIFQQAPVDGVSVGNLNDVDQLISCHPLDHFDVNNLMSVHALGLILAIMGIYFGTVGAMDTEYLCEVHSILFLLGSFIVWTAAAYGISILRPLMIYRFQVIACRQLVISTSVLICVGLPLVLSTADKSSALLVGGSPRANPAQPEMAVSFKIPPKVPPDVLAQGGVSLVRTKALPQVEIGRYRMLHRPAWIGFGLWELYLPGFSVLYAKPLDESKQDVSFVLPLLQSIVHVNRGDD